MYASFTSAPASILLCTDMYTPHFTGSAARGLDVPDIDWVIQFHPPTDPSQFTHRSGRTARANRPGNALIMLTPDELCFVDFLRVRKVFCHEFTPALIHPDSVLDLARSASMSDREIYEKGIVAFVSWVRSYTQHEAAYIFNLANINVADAARCFGLLRIPRIPEFKNADVSGFQVADCNTDEIRFFPI